MVTGGVRLLVTSAVGKQKRTSVGTQLASPFDLVQDLSSYCTHTHHSLSVDVRGRLRRVSSFLLISGAWGSTQVVNLGSKPF